MLFAESDAALLFVVSILFADSVVPVVFLAASVVEAAALVLSAGELRLTPFIGILAQSAGVMAPCSLGALVILKSSSAVSISTYLERTEMISFLILSKVS